MTPVNIFALTLGLLQFSVFALENGQARRPPMGYNTWNVIPCGAGAFGRPHVLLSLTSLMAVAGLQVQYQRNFNKANSRPLGKLGPERCRLRLPKP